MSSNYTIRPLNSSSVSELEIVAERMKSTLVEVLDADSGQSMYSKEWLVDRVKQHIDGRLHGQVYLAVVSDEIIGHVIVRVEKSKEESFGLFSTIYVMPEFRNLAVATELIKVGEEWMSCNQVQKFVTYTLDQNDKLIRLFKKHGYTVSRTFPDKQMIEISKIK